MTELRTRLVSSTDGRALPGFRVEVEWWTAPTNELPAMPARRSTLSDSMGSVVLDLPEPSERSGAMNVLAYAPDGRRIAGRADVPGDTWKVEPPEAPAAAGGDANVAVRERLTGRVVDATGRAAPPSLPVQIIGETGGGERVVLLTTVTAAGGYFRGDRPRGTLARAWGRVDGVDASAIPVDEKGRIEGRVVIVTDAPLGDREDCDCELPPARTPDADDLAEYADSFSVDLGGRCVDLTMPNRVVDEVSYFKVVRVTQPAVQGLTLPKRLDAATQARIRALIPMSQPGPSPSPSPRSAGTAPVANDVLLRADIATRLFSSPAKLDVDNLDSALEHSEIADIESAVLGILHGSAARVPMDTAHTIDWDETPTIHQAVTAAHGHLLQYRQVWRADGYSLGDLLYSLPLAPAQKKLVSMVDWSRTETSKREEWTREEEQLNAFLERDRDVTEIVDSHLRETSAGGSRAHTWGGGGGLGIGAIGTGWGFFAGVAGGGGGSSSQSWQDSGRSLSAETMQSIRDGTIQGASAVRSSRSTVIQTDAQVERATAVTEVVVNYNHCHALTIQYFEVLRHFTVTHELAGVQECLFVPLPMRWFDRAKALRWRETLLRFLREPALRDAFAATERVETSWVGTDLPVRSFAEEAPEVLEGELWVSFVIPRPRDDADGKFQVDRWKWLSPFLRTSALELWTSRFNQRTAAERDLIFRQQVAPGIAAALVERLRFSYITTDGASVEVPLDPTLVGRYAEGTPLYIKLSPSSGLPAIPREDIQMFQVRLDGVEFPEDAHVLVHRGKVRYETPHIRHVLFDEPRTLNDLAFGDAVLVPTPLSREEMKNPRREDRDLSDRLVRHLNEHLEYYHQVIWMTMDPARRYMLLDGFVAPNANGRSIASVVENRLLGIVGNSLVLPVSPGNMLAPPLRNSDGAIVPLMEHYAVPPERPIRITVPTRGVFAEAVQGTCNACEKVDDKRLWRFDESPIPDSPLPPEPASLESRAEAPVDPTPTAGPPPIINIQAPPAVPDPIGLGNVFSLLAKSNLFKDVTGLQANQEAALGAYKAALDTAKSFAGHASAAVLQQDLGRGIDGALEAAASARDNGLITSEQARSIAYNALSNLVGNGAPSDAHPLADPAVRDVVDRAADAEQGSVVVSSPNEKVSVSYGGGGGVAIGASFVPVAKIIEAFESISVWEDTSTGGATEITTVTDFEALAGWNGATDIALRWKAVEAWTWARKDPADPTKFQLGVRYVLVSPGKAAGELAPAPEGRVPVAVLLHGAHNATYAVTGGEKPTPSFGGYLDLQEHLATLGVLSISIDDNLSNLMSASSKNAMMENRARIVVAAINHLRTLDKSDPDLKDRIDFGRVLLFGHSRGGEAMARVAQFNSDKNETFEKFGVCAMFLLAPTDAFSAQRPGITKRETRFLALMRGTHDGDIHGRGGLTGKVSTSHGHYGRADCPKSHIEVDLATHNRFNSVWVDATYKGKDDTWLKPADVSVVLDEAEHKTLLRDYVGGLARWLLGGDKSAAELFDGRLANSVPKAKITIAHWFASPFRQVEPFEAAKNSLGRTRSLASSEGVEIIETTDAKALPESMTYKTKAVYVPLDSSATSSAARIESTLGSASKGYDVTSFTSLELDVAILGDTSTDAKTKAIALPELSITLTHGASGSSTANWAAVSKFRAPRRPIFREIPKTVGSSTMTPVVFLPFQTLRVPLSSFSGLVKTDVRSVQILGDSSTGSKILIDNIRFVKEI